MSQAGFTRAVAVGAVALKTVVALRPTAERRKRRPTEAAVGLDQKQAGKREEG